MQLHTHTSHHVLNALSLSLGKNPSSFDTMACLCIQATNDSEIKNLAATIAEEFAGEECDILLLGSHTAFIIGKYHVVDMIETFLHLYGPVGLYMENRDLCGDWQEMRLAFNHLLPQVPSMNQLVPQPCYEANLPAFMALFGASESSREQRNELHILLVEDEMTARYQAVRQLKKNYTLCIAGNVEEAVINYCVHAPDVVLLDIGLPDGSGFDALQRITQIDPGAYVVMLSAHDDLDNIMKSLNEGANGFIAKPLSQEKIRHYVT